MVKPAGDPPVRGPSPANVSNLRVLVDQDSFGATVRFNVVALTNTFAIFLLRSFTNSPKAATVLKNIPRVVQSNTYDDRDLSIIGKQVWYWVQLQGADDNVVTNVGPVTVVVKKGAAPHVVNWVEVSSDFSGDDSVQINLACELFPGTDASGGVAVFIQNYQGNAASVLIYQDTSQVLSFHLKMTGEAVTLFVAAVNVTGALSALSAGVNLTLNGLATRPCRLTGLAAVEGNGFTQISFDASPEPNIKLYRLYRGAFGGVFSGAALVATLVPTDERRYSIRDATVNGHASTYQWYVTAINARGESTASDAVLPATPWS
jgi:hypothetical protein